MESASEPVVPVSFVEGIPPEAVPDGFSSEPVGGVDGSPFGPDAVENDGPTEHGGNGDDSPSFVPGADASSMEASGVPP